MSDITFLTLFLTWIPKYQAFHWNALRIYYIKLQKIPHCTKTKDDLMINSLRYLVDTLLTMNLSIYLKVGA